MQHLEKANTRITFDALNNIIQSISLNTVFDNHIDIYNKEQILYIFKLYIESYLGIKTYIPSDDVNYYKEYYDKTYSRIYSKYNNMKLSVSYFIINDNNEYILCLESTHSYK